MEDRSKKMITVSVAKFCQKQKLHENNMNETDKGTDKLHHFLVHLTSQCSVQVKQQNWPFAKFNKSPQQHNLPTRKKTIIANGMLNWGETRRHVRSHNPSKLISISENLHFALMALKNVVSTQNSFVTCVSASFRRILDNLNESIITTYLLATLAFWTPCYNRHLNKMDSS